MSDPYLGTVSIKPCEESKNIEISDPDLRAVSIKPCEESGEIEISEFDLSIVSVRSHDSTYIGPQLLAF